VISFACIFEGRIVYYQSPAIYLAIVKRIYSKHGSIGSHTP